MVESNSPAPDPVQAARDALAAAQDAQQAVGRGLRYDTLDEVLYGAACGLTVLASGLGGAIEFNDALWLRLIVPVMYLVALGLLGLGIHRFRRKNGVWVSGFSPRWSGLVAIGLMVVIGGLVFASTYAGNAGQWGWVALATVAGAAAAFGYGRLWLHVYRRETAGGPRG